MSLLDIANEQQSESLYWFTDDFMDNSSLVEHYNIPDNNYARIMAFVESLRSFAQTKEPLSLDEIRKMWEVYSPKEFTNAQVMNSQVLSRTHKYSGSIISSYAHLLSEDVEKKTLARAHLALSDDSLDVLVMYAGYTEDDKLYVDSLPRILFSQFYVLVEK